jgi:hypothetical protein
VLHPQLQLLPTETHERSKPVRFERVRDRDLTSRKGAWSDAAVPPVNREAVEPAVHVLVVVLVVKRHGDGSRDPIYRSRDSFFTSGGWDFFEGYGRSNCNPCAFDCASAFDRLASCRRYVKANDLDRLGASFHGLTFCSREPAAHEAGDHIAIKPMGAHKQGLGRAMRAAGE